MNKSMMLAVLLAAAALTGCAQFNVNQMPPKGEASSQVALQPLDVRTRPRVEVKDGQIRVQPEVLIFAKREGPLKITWQLPADGKLRFDPRAGITIDGEVLDKLIQNGEGVALDRNQKEIGNCVVSNDRLQFSCEARNSRLTVFKYTIRVLDGDRLIVRDPAGILGADL